MEFLTTSQAAKILFVSTATLRRYEAQGLIKSQRTNGGHRRFLAKDVEQLKADLAQRPTPRLPLETRHVQNNVQNKVLEILRQKGVEDICFNNFEDGFYFQDGKRHSFTAFTSEREIQNFILGIALANGIDLAKNPAADYRMHDGSRMMAFMPPLAAKAGFAIRKHHSCAS